MVWSWCEETSHLEVRPATRSDGSRAVKIDGGEAKSDRDWIYWRLPTVVSAEAFGGERKEVNVRIDKGEVRIGVLSAHVKLGDNWCDDSRVGHAFFLDTSFGVIRDGDKIIATGSELKSTVGDVISVRLHNNSLEFSINDKHVGQIPILDSMQQLRVAVQMWDKGDAVYLVEDEEKRLKYLEDLVREKEEEKERERERERERVSATEREKERVKIEEADKRRKNLVQKALEREEVQARRRDKVAEKARVLEATRMEAENKKEKEEQESVAREASVALSLTTGGNVSIMGDVLSGSALDISSTSFGQSPIKNVDDTPGKPEVVSDEQQRGARAEANEVEGEEEGGVRASTDKPVESAVPAGTEPASETRVLPVKKESEKQDHEKELATALVEQAKLAEEAETVKIQKEEQESAAALAEQAKLAEEAETVKIQKEEEESAAALAEQAKLAEEADTVKKQKEEEESAAALAEQAKLAEEAETVKAQKEKEESVAVSAEQAKLAEEAETARKQKEEEESAAALAETVKKQKEEQESAAALVEQAKLAEEAETVKKQKEEEESAAALAEQAKLAEEADTAKRQKEEEESTAALAEQAKLAEEAHTAQKQKEDEKVVGKAKADDPAEGSPVSEAEKIALVGRRATAWFADNASGGQNYFGKITEIWGNGSGQKMWRVAFEGRDVDGDGDDVEEDYTAEQIVKMLLPESKEAVVGRKVRNRFYDADGEKENKDYEGEITEIWENGTGHKMWRVVFKGRDMDQDGADDEEDFTDEQIVEILLS